MEMQQLRYFAAVARTGNFSRAAAACRVAQPSLSQQIRKLEEEIGERLFERTRPHARLTGAGALFLPHAEEILARAERGRREVGEMHGRIGGRLAVGVLPTIAPYFLPELVRVFRRKYPAVELVVHEETTARLLKELEEGGLDLALVSDVPPGTRAELESLLTEELLLCGPARHPLFARRRLVAADLQDEKFILMQEGHCLGTQAQKFCRTKGFHPHISCRSAQIGTVLAMVRAGLGVSLIPRMAREEGSRGVVYRSLDGLRPRRTLYLAFPQPRRPHRAADEFARLARAQARAMEKTAT